MWQYYVDGGEFGGECVGVLSHVQLFATPWAVAHQAPLSVGFFQARILEWVAVSDFTTALREELKVLDCA